MISNQKPEVSVVVPVYMNAETLPELCAQLQQVLEPAAAYEVLFVNDASPDQSLAVLENLASKDHRVAVLDLAKNVGQHSAVMIGLAHARGNKTVIMDADLQDPPDALPSLLAELDQGFAAVFAGRRGRYQSTGRLLTSRLFKRLLHVLGGVPIDAGIFMAINRQMRKRLVDCRWPVQPFVVGMVGCMNLPMTSVPVERQIRPSGQSAYSFWGRLASAARGLAGVILYRHFPSKRFTSPPQDHPQVQSYIGMRFTTTLDQDI